jgi:hypothetical protein
MTKLNFNEKLLDEDGKVIDEGPWKTLGSTCALVCTTRQLRGDEGMTPEKAAEIGFLALKIKFQPECEISAEEVVLLKERVGKGCPPVIVVRCHRLLEGKPQQPSAEEFAK